MPSSLGMLSGLFRGMVDKKKASEAREQQKEMFSLEKANKQLQQTMLKLKAQQLQMEKAREDRLWAEIGRRRAERGGGSGGDAGQKEPAKFGDSFKQGGITDQLAGYGLDIGPDEAALMGGKFQDIYENNYKERDFNRKLGQDQYKRMKDAQEVDRIPVNTAQGTFLQTLPKNPGLAGMAGPGGMIQTGPPPV